MPRGKTGIVKTRQTENPGAIPGLLFAEKIIFSHPDYTVGSGISPDQLKSSRANGKGHITAGREFHPALKILRY